MTNPSVPLQLYFSENNELIVSNYSANLMHKIIIPINNLHYLHVVQSNHGINRFDVQLQFSHKETDFEKHYDWIELTSVVEDQYVYNVKSNIVFTTNIDNISFKKKQTLKEKTDIYCLMANEHKIFYLNLNWIDRVETYLKNPIVTKMRPIYYLRIDNNRKTFSNIKTKPFTMFAKIIMKPVCAASFDVDILDVLTFYYQHRSTQIDVLSEQSKNTLFKLKDFLNNVPLILYL